MATYDHLDDFLESIEDPIQFIELCDYQNNEGQLVFNTPPNEEIINEFNKYMDGLIEKTHNELITSIPSWNIGKVIWNMKEPLDNAKFLFRISKNITLSCTIDFIDIISWELYVMLFKKYFMEYLARDYLIIIKSNTGSRITYGKPNTESMGAFFRWIEKNICKTYYGVYKTDIQNNDNTGYTYNSSMSTKIGRAGIYSLAGSIENQDLRYSIIQKYESNTLLPIDTRIYIYIRILIY